MLAYSSDTEIYSEDLERAERQFSIAQRLHTITQDLPQDSVSINISDVDAFTDGQDEFRLRFQDAGSYLVEQLADDPIPKLPTHRETVWVPKMRFKLPVDDSGFRRPTSFEVSDIVERRTRTSDLPQQPFSRQLLSVDLAFIEGNFITVEPAPEQLILIGPDASKIQREEFRPGARKIQPNINSRSSGMKQFNLNRDADNRYTDARVIDTETEDQLLTALEEFAEGHDQIHELDPYVMPIEVSTIDVAPNDRLSTHVGNRRTLLQVGNGAINPHDRSELVYGALSKFAQTQVAESFGLIRMMTGSGILTAFIIVDDSEAQS